MGVALIVAPLAPALALAEEPTGAVVPPSNRPHVLIQYDASQPSELVDRATTRLRFELRAAGFDCTLSPATEPPSESEAGAPYALIALTIENDQLELDITSSAVGSSSHVILVGTQRELGAVMLQASEFLRAGQVPRVGGAAPPRVAPPPQPSSSSPAPTRRHWLIDLGPALLSNWGAHDLLPLASFGVGYSPSLRSSVRAVFDVPVEQAQYETQRGIVDYRVGLGTLNAEYAVLHSTRASLSLGLLVGAARVLSAGRPVAPLAARDGALWALTLGVEAETELRVSRWLSLTLHGSLLSLSPNPLLAILDEERRLGSPSVLFGLGLRVADH